MEKFKVELHRKNYPFNEDEKHFVISYENKFAFMLTWDGKILELDTTAWQGSEAEINSHYLIDSVSTGIHNEYSFINEDKEHLFYLVTSENSAKVNFPAIVTVDKEKIMYMESLNIDFLNQIVSWEVEDEDYREKQDFNYLEKTMLITISEKDVMTIDVDGDEIFHDYLVLDPFSSSIEVNIMNEGNYGILDLTEHFEKTSKKTEEA